MWIVEKGKLDPAIAPKDMTVVLLDTEVCERRTLDGRGEAGCIDRQSLMDRLRFDVGGPWPLTLSTRRSHTAHAPGPWELPKDVVARCQDLCTGGTAVVLLHLQLAGHDRRQRDGQAFACGGAHTLHSVQVG